MVSRTARTIAVFIAPLAIASLVLSLVLEEESPRAAKVLRLVGVSIPSIILTASAFIPGEVEL